MDLIFKTPSSGLLGAFRSFEELELEGDILELETRDRGSILPGAFSDLELVEAYKELCGEALGDTF